MKRFIFALISLYAQTQLIAQTQYDYYDDSAVVGGADRALNGIIWLFLLIVTVIILILVIGGISYIYYWFNPEAHPNYKRTMEVKKKKLEKLKEKEIQDKKQIILETKEDSNFVGNQNVPQEQIAIPIYADYLATFTLTKNPKVVRDLELRKMYSTDGEKLLSTFNGTGGNNIRIDINPKPGTKIICDGAYDDFGNRWAKDILIPDSVIAIGYNAFMFLGAFDVEIPSSVRYITGNPFGQQFGYYNKAYCDSPYFKLVSGELFSSDMTLYVANIENETKIIKIPENVKIIGRGAISKLDNLELVKISKSVVALAENAISACKNLTAIVFDGRISIIEPTAIYGCKHLKVIYVPVGEKEYYKSILPTELGSIVIELSQTDIAEEKLLFNIFILEDKKKARINKLRTGIRYINYEISEEEREFIEGIKNDYILSSVTQEEREEGVLDWCEHEKEEHYEEKSDESLYSKDGKKFLAYGSNSGKYSIKKGVEIVCDGSFCILANNGACEKYITIPDSVKVIGNFVFWYTDFKDFTIPESVKKITGNPFVACEVNLICNSPAFCFEDDVLYDQDKTIILSVIKNINRTTPMSIPQTVKVIGRHSFYGISIHGGVMLPQSVIYIGESAFEHTIISEIKLNGKVFEIGKSAFAWSYIKKIELPNSVIKLGESAFSYCENLEYIKLSTSLQRIEEEVFKDCEKLNNVHIPEGVKVIKKDAFRGCKCLTDMYLPNSLEKIEEGAFYNCGFQTIVVPKHTIIADGAFMENCKVISRE